MNFFKLAIATALTAAVTSTAHATVVGSTVNGQWLAPGFGTLLNETTTVTDPGVEFDFVTGDAVISVDITEDDVTILFDLGSFGQIGAATTWTVSGFTDSFFDIALSAGDASLVTGVSGDATSFTVDFVNFVAADHGQVNTFTFDRIPAIVPLPAGGLLLMSAILGLRAARRRTA